jgi:hypothetical protein
MTTVILRRQSQGRLFVNLEQMAERLKADVVGRILRRVAQGRDIDDRNFAPYTTGYKRKLKLAKESDLVDIRLTGGLLNSVKVTRIDMNPSGFVMYVGPDTGAVNKVKFQKGSMERDGKGSATNNQVGYWLQNHKKKPRKWLGLSPTDKANMRRYLWDAIKAVK